ncbi:MAG: type IV pilus assembly protein PilM [Candidatus Yanofskybacteria bacterium]|nr:type IV pilus assembly protein PilM [Candidatus Yanofskybacteria bacterium]
MSFFDFGKPKSKLGIDIGTASIKIVELSKEAGRFKLENYGLFELESVDEALNAANRSAGGAAQLSSQDLAWGMREVLKRSKIKTRDAVASIPSFSTFSTIITMPYLSEKDMAKSIPFEARKYIPLPINDVVLDWSIINIANQKLNQSISTSNLVPPISGGAKPPVVEVFLVAVPKQETERYRDIMKLAGLNLRALELENSALIRALLGNDLSPAAIINIGGRSTSILIVDGGYERIGHNYEIGGFEITKTISNSLNISLKRAEELKRSLGIKDANNNVIQQAMSSLIDMMAFETKKTIHSYEELKNIKISRVILVGGLANMPNFANYFGTKLGLPLAIGNPSARLIVPKELEKIQSELNTTLTLAIGLAMREI